MNRITYLIVVCAVSAGGFLGLCQFGEPSFAQAKSAHRAGTLQGLAGHHAEGTVDLIGNQLTLSQITVDRVPDGRVYLTVGADYEYGVELGKLQQFSGTVRYTIPPEVNPTQFDSVLIWCDKFNVDIGFADLTPSP